jgi:hypothetical protein
MIYEFNKAFIIDPIFSIFVYIIVPILLIVIASLLIYGLLQKN